MIRVSVAIMAHPRRADFVPELQAKLDRPAAVVWDDGSNSRWGTGRRALAAYDPAATHHLVLQDDSVIPRNLVAGVEQMLAHAPQDVPVCLYVGKVRPYREMVTEYVGRAAGGASWLVMDRLNWGVAVILPTSMVEAVVAAGDAQTIPNYDSRMSTFFEAKGIDVWYPWPSLVDHRESPSLVPGRVGAGRVAHQFIGATASALDTEYTGTVLRLPNSDSYRPGGQPNMLFICDQFDNYSVPTCGAKFTDHYFEATTPGQVAHLQMPHHKRRGVRPATEDEAKAFYERQRAALAEPVSEPAPVTPPSGAEQIQEPAPVDPSADGTKVEEEEPAADGDEDPAADGQEPEQSPEDAETPEDAAVETGAADEVPDGTAEEVLAWVGDDAARAAAAIAAEEARDKPRKTLLGQLGKLTAAE